MIYFIFAVVVLLMDQVTKWIVVKEMYLGESIPVMEGIFYLTSHRNAGAAFGILQNQRWFFIVITILVVVGIIYYLLQLKGEKKLMSWALGLILGGALGNFADRLLYGEVVDFLDVKIVLGTFYYDFPIFNVADSALVIGVGIILIDTIMETVKEIKNKKLES